MLPLRYSQGLESFPKKTLLTIVGLLIINLFIHFSHSVPLFSYNPDLATAKWWQIYSSCILAPNASSFILHIWYLWIFAPLLGHINNKWLFAPSFLMAPFLMISILEQVHIFADNNVHLYPQLFFSVIIGWLLRQQIWSHIDTLVFGPRLFQVFEVPSYVLLFFYLFYFFLTQIGHELSSIHYLIIIIGLSYGFCWSLIDSFLTKARK